MHIKEIIRQHRRDFTAIYQCEHCGHETQGGGYDDARYHNQIIPKMRCSKCDKHADDSYRPLTPKYAEGHFI